MELKRYQTRVLDEIRAFLRALASEQAKGSRHASMDAWQTATGHSMPQTERRDGMGRDLPNFCIKIPTGGGKTLLASHVLGDVFSTLLRSRNGAGLALWIVPSDQIYKDTLKTLRDRQHPYHEALRNGVGRPVEVWEKHEVAGRLSASRLQSALNVVLLKLASANRETRDQLRMFQDSGGSIMTHFPSEDDEEAHEKLLKEVTNLETIGASRIVRTSLANLIRLHRPPVILDEGHKAYSSLAQQTLEGFNASVIVELSATPSDEANVLVRVSGQELLDEEMIKLPINVAVAGEADWRKCLSRCKEHRDGLARTALEVSVDGRAIRPIVLVQVERVGEKQRDKKFIHAEDVKAFLIEKLGVAAAEIAIKTSEKDDIEGIDLLDDGCRITWIITKSALQEGWDCPYAYFLVSLNNSQSKLSMTQLVGRVLRQPFAAKTGTPELDESYVYCLRKKAQEVVREVKNALEKEGYEGEAASVVDHSEGGPRQARPVARVRKQFRGLYREFAGKIYLPRFCVGTRNDFEALDYYRHLLARVDVASFAYSSIDWNLRADLALAKESVYRLTIGEELETVRQDRALAAESDDRVASWIAANLPFDHFSFRERALIVRRAVERALALDGTLAGRLALVKFPLRDRIVGFVEEGTDLQTHAAFKRLLKQKQLRFYLRCVDCRFEVPSEVQLRSLRKMVRDDNSPVQRSLFETVDEGSVNTFEREVALFLDRHEKVLWWYRNEVGPEAFAIQGYRKPRIYPDFVVQRGRDKRATPEVLVLESKGEHLAGSADTEYKREVARYFESLGEGVSWQKLGSGFANSTFRFQVLDSDKHGAWADELERLLG